MKKNYILDTNVLLHDPNSLLSFQENSVLLPIEVIEEIDRFKRESTELGQNARTVSRMLDGFRAAGHLSEGVKLPNGGQLRIIFQKARTPGNGHAALFSTDSVDNRILALAFQLQKSQPKSQSILVSKDINLRIKADALGVQAEDYENDRILLKDLYTGMIEFMVSSEKLASFRANNHLELNNGRQYLPNEYCTLMDETNPKRAALTKVDPTGTKLVPIIDSREGVWGIKPRNREQHFGFDALLDDRIKLVTLMGKAGTGKTLLAMAAGLKRTVTDREFRRLVVARPTISMGKELGFLPGSLEEKLAPWMQPIHDALEMLGDLNMGHEHRRSGDLMRSGSIVVEALSYIRGRSIANQFMVIDEAQNLTPLEAKTIITRVGHGTKIVFTGDPYQIDNPYVDSSSNGFNYVVSRFRSQSVAAHIEFQKGERSELAELAANIL
ncbi:MAG: phosphate starvation-inducible protein PhoH [Verrucomicrobia bacterium]|nr:MAG: phosphate starvation-inducible protein PhoH [Verrucomicrobiota bacterium]